MYIRTNQANSGSHTGPVGLPRSAFGSTRTPAPNRALKRPNHVLINSTGSFAFMMENQSGTDIEGNHVAVGLNNIYTVPSAVLDTKSGVVTLPQKLEIQPLAWSSGSGAIDDFGKGMVTFVYKGGL